MKAKRAMPNKRREPARFVLMPRDKEIIRAVFRHRFLTRDQLQRVIGWDCLPKVNSRLRKLYDSGYLNRRFLPVQYGSPPAIYTLGPAGIAEIKQTQDQTIKHIRRNSRQDRRMSDRLLHHTLATSEFVTVMIDAARRTKSVKWFPWLSDRSVLLSMQSFFQRIKPDGLLSYEFDGRRFNFFVEVDTGSESHRRILKKLEEYHRLIESKVLGEKFPGLTRFAVLIVTLTQNRAHSLSQSLKPSPSPPVLIGSLPQLEKDPFFGQAWRQPGRTNPMPLHQNNPLLKDTSPNAVLPSLQKT